MVQVVVDILSSVAADGGTDLNGRQCVVTGDLENLVGAGVEEVGDLLEGEQFGVALEVFGGSMGPCVGEDLVAGVVAEEVF